MTDSIAGKTALITGGNSGIGFGIAKGLLEAGCHVAIWGSNPAKTRAAEAALQAAAPAGTRVLAQVCNVADESAVEAAFAQAVASFGRIDACFANAGVMQKKSLFHELSSDEWKRVMGVNVDGVFYTLRAAARHMVERSKAGSPGGRLVLMASTATIHGAQRNTAYAASKGALMAMTRALAVEYGRFGVTANAILPGWIRSDMTQAAMDDERFAAAVLPRIPVKRWGEGHDFAGIARYLVSDASAYHTGDNFVIDGAYTIF
jgi:NAD(P)-dependent dehydrogenase (short-subunit alcohol dehydrogenase family)